MRYSSKIIDWAVQKKISDSGLQKLKDSLSDAPLIAKYDPEDFDEDGIQMEEIRDVVSLPEVGAVQIGGSGDSVTNDNMNTAFSRVNEANTRGLPVLLEPGKPEDVENGGLDSSMLTEPDIFNKPRVWNTQDPEWINGHHRYFQRLLNSELDESATDMIGRKVDAELQGKAPDYLPFRDRLLKGRAEDYIEDIGEDGARSLARQLVDSRTVTEVYYVVNPDSAVAEVTGADEDLESLSQDEVEEDIRGMVSDLAQDGYEGIIYIESSGALAPPEFVSAAREEIDLRGIEEDTVLAYGGGVGTENLVDGFEYDTAIGEMETSEQIDEYLEAGADTVIVGNSIQENGGDAIL